MKSIGQVGYEAYCEDTGGKSLISGATLPVWDALDPKIKHAWEAACTAAVEYAIDHMCDKHMVGAADFTNYHESLRAPVTQNYVVPGTMIDGRLYPTTRSDRSAQSILDDPLFTVKLLADITDDDSCQRGFHGEPLEKVTPFVEFRTKAEWVAWDKYWQDKKDKEGI